VLGPVRLGTSATPRRAAPAPHWTTSGHTRQSPDNTRLPPTFCFLPLELLQNTDQGTRSASGGRPAPQFTPGRAATQESLLIMNGTASPSQVGSGNARSWLDRVGGLDSPGGHHYSQAKSSVRRIISCADIDSITRPLTALSSGTRACSRRARLSFCVPLPLPVEGTS
jgi:hypothetical protein